MTYQLVLLRHGQSEWNLANTFTGWADVGLTEKGRAEALAGGEAIAEAGVAIDIAHTSLLKRAIHTTQLVLDVLDREWIPVRRSWRLNERHYGALQGLNKKETAEKHGADQVFEWRRSYHTPPPALADDDERSAKHDPRYQRLAPEQIPASECLADVVDRMLPYWYDSIVPDLRDGNTVLIGAHGNSLRALVKHLDGISDEEISSLNIPTGVPKLYELDENLRVVSSRYLGDEEAAKKKAEAVANEAR